MSMKLAHQNQPIKTFDDLVLGLLIKYHADNFIKFVLKC
jgi:hypothetical protein